MARASLIIFYLLFFTPVAHAAILINEVAWMGTVDSSGDEWIELHNTGTDSVNIDGFSIEAQDGSPSISLLGNIPAGGYFLLERTDDNSVPNITADQIYTGALSNSGEVLTLKNADGEVLQSVDGSDDWAIGGDASTKDTLQYSGGTWITAAATPKSANSTTSSDTGESTEESTQTTNTSDESPQYEPIPYIRVVAEKEMHVTAGADTLFEGKAYDENARELDSAIYTWSFGNGTKKTGASVMHNYHLPGTYVAILSVTTERSGSSARVLVYVDEVKAKISKIDANAIYIENTGSRDLDLSHWALSQGGSVFNFPEDTIVLPHTTVPIAHADTGFTERDDVVLLYPNGNVAVAFVSPEEKAFINNSSYTAPSAPAQPSANTETLPVAQAKSSATESVATEPAPATSTTSSDLSASADRSLKSFKINGYVYLWLILVLFMSGLFFLVVRKK